MNLYRIVSFESFMNLLVNKQAYYANPLKWKDTYEGCGLRYIHDDNQVIKFIQTLFSQYEDKEDAWNVVLYLFTMAETVSDYCFCQCWSQAIDSAAMWEIYSYGNFAIQIVSDRDRIVESIVLDDGKYKREIREVQYDVSLDDKLSSYERFCRRGTDFCESFFHKRSGFGYEQEVRSLIYHADSAGAFSRSLSRYRQKIIDSNKNPNEIVAEVLAELIIEVHRELRSKYADDFMLASDGAYFKVNNLSNYVSGVRVHPKAEKWYVDLVKQICNEYDVKFLEKWDLYGKA